MFKSQIKGFILGSAFTIGTVLVLSHKKCVAKYIKKLHEQMHIKKV